jgi:DNA polymerase-1
MLNFKMALYLIDGSSYVYRAFHAIRGLTDSKGRPTNAIFGFTNTLLKIIRERKPSGIAVAFDSPVPTERHRLFEAYKAHRPKTPDELIEQMPAIRKTVEAMKIEVFETPGYEADDVLATIAEKASAEGAEVYIVTGDKDMLQLISGSVKVYDPIKDRVLDEAYVEEKFGVPPRRVVEFMALTGDAVDNIPGVKGIGEKTAKELLTGFGSLEELLSNTGRIKKERTRKLIEENLDAARLSRKLAEIDRHVPIEINLRDFAVKEPDWDALMGLFRDFEFTSLMKYIPGGLPSGRHYEAVLSTERLSSILKGIKDELSIDTEATDKDPMRAEIVGFSICSGKDEAFYIPLSHNYMGAPRQMEKDEAIALIRPLLEDEALPKIGHNIKYDMMLLKKYGMDFKGPLYDTMVASYLLNPLRANHSLDNISLEYLSRKKKTFAEVAGKEGFSSVIMDDARDYACDDASLTMDLKEELFGRLRDEELEGLYFNIEMPLIRVLASMEEAGMKIDAGKLKDISVKLEGRLASLTKRIYFLAGEEFNINSPKQLGRVLFETMGLKPGKKKKTGYSTDISVLEELSASHELPREILNWRTLYKLKNTYVDVLPALINPATGRVHTSFNQTVTATGRLSSSEPNLQNIPIRGEWGKEIREAFISEKGFCLISSDYSQIELRVLAHISGDEALLNAFRSDMDIHSRTASDIFGVAEKDVNEDMRRAAKGVNFGIIYGISPFGLGEALGVSQEEASDYIKRYFEKHPGVKAYMDETLRQAKEAGFVKTLFGRKRKIPELKSPKTRSSGERLALNSPIQGTAADIIKIAMINIHNSLHGMRARMILQVHDELLFEAPDEETEYVMKIVTKEMEGVKIPLPGGGLPVPLKVEIGRGKNWAEAH